MSTSSTIIVGKKSSLLAVLLLMAAVFGSNSLCAQMSLGVFAGPAIQMAHVSGTTFGSYFEPHLVTQAGLTARRAFGKVDGRGLAIRGGLSFESSAFRERYTPLQPAAGGDLLFVGRIDFVKASLGASYGFLISPKSSLEGFADMAYGLAVRSTFKKRVDGKTWERNGSGFGVGYYNHYLGLNLGASFAYSASRTTTFRFSPTLQYQINGVLGPDFPQYHFAGFAPRLEVDFLVPHKIRCRLNPRKGKRVLYIDEI